MALDLARCQFAVTTPYHFLSVPVTVVVALPGAAIVAWEGLRGRPVPGAAR